MNDAAPREYPNLFIGGEWVAPHSGRMIDSIDPATEQVWARIPEADADDVSRAVDAASAALRGPWSKLTPSERGALLYRLADGLDERREVLADLESHDNGKPLSDTRNEIKRAGEWLRFYAGAADKFYGEQIPYTPSALAFTRRDPVGVVGAITPWNSPVYMYSWKLGPALATGNTVVLKPAELTSVTALEVAQIVHDAGFPPGVVNVVPGYGKGAGAALAAHPGVDKIAFTGSGAVASSIVVAGAPTLKRTTLECGGKNAQVVFADANLDAAVATAVVAAFRSTGQSCTAGSRLLIERARYEEFVARLVEGAAALRVGSPFDPATQMGPHASLAQLTKTRGHIAGAVEEGAELLCGGGRPVGLDEGFYVEPTVFAVRDQRAAVSREEIFGPVVTVQAFDDEDEATALANDTDYGLVAGVWTADSSRALRVSSRLKAGLISANTFRPIHFTLPYGGVGVSGLGRENGIEALHSYTEVKTVVLDYST